jgi:uncharacterized protein YndB with AHSA1/START domain
MKFEVEVPGTPEQVWDAIATGPGISAWFIPADVDDSTITHHYGPGMSADSPIIAAEKPHRFAFDDGPAGATEFLVEARSGGTCVVRVVIANFTDDGAEAGWTAALLALQLYMEHFTGRHAATIVAGGVVKGPDRRAWEELLDALGVDEPVVGERFEAKAGPPLAGVVEGRTGTIATLRLDAPAAGLGFIGVGGSGEEQVFSFLRAQLFGDDREALAARDEPRWRELLDGRLALVEPAG